MELGEAESFENERAERADTSGHEGDAKDYIMGAREIQLRSRTSDREDLTHDPEDPLFGVRKALDNMIPLEV